jgi:hypothetical protein
LYVPRKQAERGLLQLEAAHAIEITKLVEYVERKEDPLPLTQVIRTHQHIDPTELQTVRRLKAEVQRETRDIKGSIAEKNKRKMASEEDARTIAT